MSHVEDSALGSATSSMSLTSSRSESAGRRGCVLSDNETMMDIRLPSRISPDTMDKFSRPPLVDEKLFHLLGHGAQGFVFGAILHKDSERRAVAVKVHRLRDANDDALKRLRREWELSTVLSNPNVVSFYESFWDCDTDGSPSNFYLVYERMDFSLLRYLGHLSRNDGGPDEKVRNHSFLCALMVQILKALQYLNERGVVHRDLNPKNIGVNQNGFEVKLLDFGCSRYSDKHGNNSIVLGTPMIYRPMEVILQHPYDYKVDVWAAALIAVEFLGNKLMYPTTPRRDLFGVKSRILDVCGLPEHKYSKTFGDKLLNERERAATLDEAVPLRRLDAERGPLTKKNLLELLRRMLSVDPSERPSAEECLRMSYLSKMNEKYDQLLATKVKTGNHRESFFADLKLKCEKV